MIDNKSTHTILLVEDEPRIRRELSHLLTGAGFRVREANSVRSACEALEPPCDMMLLDLGLPDGDGLELCRTLRSRGNEMSIIIITARDAPQQRVLGLDLGADDYLVKPFHPPELLARVRSVLRRANREVSAGRVTHGPLWADPDSRTAGCRDEKLELKPREFDLLLFLLQHTERTWTRDQLLNRIWGMGFEGSGRTVDLHIRRLRTKVEDDPSDPHWIQTVWGVGYRMGASPEHNDSQEH